ncbi:MAG: hypothetical protein RBU45_08380 [Myxococcota bacterium]|nr:hypothetical protein [Myxococcota bacterium]
MNASPCPLVLLVHAAGPGPYAEMVRRARLLQLGAEQRHPRLLFDRVLGRTPDDDPVTGTAPTLPRLIEYSRRMIQGDGAQQSEGARNLHLPGADWVWIVSERTDDVDQQVAFAEEVGLEVERIPSEVQARLLADGLAAERRDVAQRAGELTAPDDGPAFRSPEAVVFAYFCGAEGILGVQALPLARLVRSGGNAYGRKSRIETAGLRISLANGIMRKAMASRGWRPEMLPLLWLAYVERGSMDRAAQLLALGEGDSARRQAARLKGRALDLIRAVIAPQEQAA